MADNAVPASLVELPSGDASALARVANNEDAGLLLVPGDATAGNEATLARLVEEIECPVLLVR
jgi:Tfp pilus assembly pilus retraction ATPase PilT